MLSLIRRALDAKRLTVELEAAEAEIAALRAELSSRLLGPSFREVAKDFDATRFHDLLIDRVVEDLAPMLERDALAFLKSGMKSLARETRYSPRMEGAVAYDAFADVYAFEFQTVSMGTRVNVANF